MIEVQDLTKYYGDLKALDSVSFQVEQGEIVGFLGPNGAGKTTLMKILTCYMSATSGQASVAGFDVYKNSLDVRRRVGYLPERVPLYQNMIVYDYLNHIGEMRGLNRKARQGAIDELVDTCGLRPVIHRVIDELSKGFRQRVGLAQAIIHKPEVLILDEPTAGLDPRQIIEIRDLIRTIGQEKTVIFSTHILQEIPATCNRILILHEGRIVGDGSLEELADAIDESEGYHIQIETSERDNAVVRTIAGLRYVRDVRHLGSSAGVHRLLVESDGSAAFRVSLFDLIYENNWQLASFAKTETSLEEIFLTMTGPRAEELRRITLSRKKRRGKRVNPRTNGPSVIDVLDVHDHTQPKTESDAEVDERAAERADEAEVRGAEERVDEASGKTTTSGSNISPNGEADRDKSDS